MGHPVYYINIIFTELRIYNNNAIILRERERKRERECVCKVSLIEGLLEVM